MSSNLPTLSPLPDHPMATVIVPNYNHAEFLGETMRSILDQDYDAIELLIMDGGSNDQSVEIIKGFASDPRVQWNSEPDIGPMDACFKGLELARGDLIASIPSNDTYVPGAIREMVEEFIADPQLGFVGGWFQGIDSQGNRNDQGRFLRQERVDIPVDEIIVNYRLPHVNASMFRRDLARETIVPELNRHVGDTVFTVHLMLEAVRRGGHVRAIPKVLNNTRNHDSNRGGNTSLTLADRVEIKRGFKRLTGVYKSYLSRSQIRAMRRYSYLRELRFRMHPIHQTFQLIPPLLGYIWYGGYSHVLRYVGQKLRLLKPRPEGLGQGGDPHSQKQA